jgi:hypothetical protein
VSPLLAGRPRRRINGVVHQPPPDPVRDSLLGNLGSSAPDMDAVQDFDVVVDRINRVIALFSAQLAKERARDLPDTGHLETLRRRRDHFVAEWEALTPRDPVRIAQLHRECVELLRAARGQG